MEDIKGYCIDSDILIDYLRGFNNARVFLLEAAKITDLYISVVSVVEVYAGKDTKNEGARKQIAEFLANFRIIELNYALAQYAGGLRRDYAKPFADSIIAATALTFQLTLVTKNTKHYLGIPDLHIETPY